MVSLLLSSFCHFSLNVTVDASVFHYNEKSLNRKFMNLNLSEENDNEFNVLQNINVNIGKYLLSLFYYKDIILDVRDLSNLDLKSAIKGDSKAQFDLGNCYCYGQGIRQ